MSGLFKGIKKAVNKVGSFLKDNWKKIVIAAAVVFTAGVATVGFAGMSTAFSSLTAGGMSSFMAGLKVAGSTLWAGATSIAGTLGIGPGAQGFVAQQAGLQGATLGSGALAAKLGGKTAQANMANAAANSTAAGGSGMATSAGGEGLALMEAPKDAVASGAMQGPPAPVVQKAVEAPAKKSLLDTLGGAALVQGGMGMLQGYYQGKALEEQQPFAAWGQNLDGSAPSFVLPGQLNPQTGQPMTEEEARAYNEQMAAGPVPA